MPSLIVELSLHLLVMHLHANTCCQDSVGRIIVHYMTCLWSPVWGSRAYQSHSLSFNIHLDIQKFDVDTRGAETEKFRSVPNLVITTPENTANSGDHNGGIPASICALGDENRNLPCFCLPTLTRNPLGVPGRIIHR